MSLFEAPVTTEVKFEDLVGEGKKYRDNDAAAKALAEKDRFIDQLQREQAEARALITQQNKSQEILDRLEELRKTSTAEHEPAPQVVERVVENKGLTIEDVDKLMAEREASRRRANNVELVKTEMVKAHGPSYPSVLNSLASKLGVTTEYIENMAGTAPQALLQLVQADRPATGFVPPSSHTPGVFQPTGGGPQKRSFYKKIMDTDHDRYFSKAVQNQMYKDAMLLKEEFRDISD